MQIEKKASKFRHNDCDQDSVQRGYCESHKKTYEKQVKRLYRLINKLRSDKQHDGRREHEEMAATQRKIGVEVMELKN